jgi:hypothetical protein
MGKEERVKRGTKKKGEKLRKGRGGKKRELGYSLVGPLSCEFEKQSKICRMPGHGSYITD